MTRLEVNVGLLALFVLVAQTSAYFQGSSASSSSSSSGGIDGKPRSKTYTTSFGAGSADAGADALHGNTYESDKYLLNSYHPASGGYVGQQVRQPFSGGQHVQQPFSGGQQVQQPSVAQATADAHASAAAGAGGYQQHNIPTKYQQQNIPTKY